MNLHKTKERNFVNGSKSVSYFWPNHFNPSFTGRPRTFGNIQSNGSTGGGEVVAGTLNNLGNSPERLLFPVRFVKNIG